MFLHKYNSNHELSTDSDDEDGDDAEEEVVIHKKGRALKKSDDNGKAKKKSRVVVEVRFHKLALIICKMLGILCVCDFDIFLTFVCLSGRARRWRHEAYPEKPETLRRK